MPADVTPTLLTANDTTATALAFVIGVPVSLIVTAGAVEYPEPPPVTVMPVITAPTVAVAVALDELPPPEMVTAGFDV